MKRPQPQFWKWSLRVAVAALLIAGVFSLFSLESLGEVLSRCRVVPLLHALALFFCACVSVGLAWQVLLRPWGYKLGLLPAIRLSMLGFFFNNLVPSGVTGEFYRVFAIGRMGVDRVAAVTSVFIERWSAFLALILATAFSILGAWPILRGVQVGSTLGRFYEPLASVRLDWLLLIFLGLLSAGFLGTSIWLIHSVKSGCPQKWERYRLGISVPEFVQGLGRYRHCVWEFLLATCINLASPLLEGLAFSSIADALGLELSPALFLVFTPLFRALNHLPITINAVGTQEVASVVFWQPLGALPEQAVAISLLIHALKITISLLGGPLYFCGREYRLERALEESDDAFGG